MNTLLRLAKKSAKKTFSQLREKSPLFCPLLNEPIQVTKLFLDHIAFNIEKQRKIKEMIERLLIIPFIEEILESGTTTIVRHQEGREFFRISKCFGNDIFTIILVKQLSGILLLSCFREY